MITGIVVKNMNGYFYVQDDSGTVHECKVRGRLKKGRYSLLVGDRVTISEDGFVESIHDRHNAMVRPAVANIDQVVLVVAAHEPDINDLIVISQVSVVAVLHFRQHADDRANIRLKQHTATGNTTKTTRTFLFET